MRLSCAALVALTIAVLPVPSRAQDGVFVSYEAMRATLDGLMKSRSIADLMIVFGGADEMTEQQLAGLEGQVRQIYPADFTEAAVMRHAELENGWSQEVISYWTGVDYVYAYILMHDREDAFVAVNFRFNSDFSALNALF